MESRAKVAGHPIHPMLVVFPLGLLTSAVVFDVIYLVSGNAAFAFTSFAVITVGVLGGLVAGVFGVFDWLAIPHGTRARAVATWHGVSALIVLGLSALSWALRFESGGLRPGAGAIASSFGGAALLLLTGWLGGELVDRLGIGVDTGAHPNSPSSLSGHPADAALPAAPQVPPERQPQL